MLQGFGCSVELADNGQAALRAVGQNAYDLVLMDCMMPEMDGYQATAEIRRRQGAGQLPHFPIIALTANAIEGDREKCLVAGMDDYLAKPFRAEALLRVVKSWAKPALALAVAQAGAPEPTPEPPASTEACLNATALETISGLDPDGGDGFLHHIVALYLDNAGKLLEALEAAWAKGELDAIRSVSHTLKSSSNQVGAHRLAELCRAVENEARNQRYDSSGQALARIRQEFTDTRAALGAYLGSSSPVT